MFGDSRSMSLALDRYLTTPPDLVDDEYTADTDMPTAEELAQEAAYYAHLEAQQQATDNLMRQLSEAVGDDDGDDMGYCGPTCGRFGNW